MTDGRLGDGRVLDRADRVKALRRGLRRREKRLQNSMAHVRDPRQSDLDRWAVMHREIAEFRAVLDAVLDGHDPPLSARTGSLTRELPDAI